MYGISILSIIPLRRESNDKSEIVSQVVFGEIFTVLLVKEKWVQIQLQEDGYSGWIDRKQMYEISKKDYMKISKAPKILSTELISSIYIEKEFQFYIPKGSHLSFLKNKNINTLSCYSFCFYIWHNTLGIVFLSLNNDEKLLFF